MFRQGPIPPTIHGLLDYVVGALFVAIPFLLDFAEDAAVAVAVVAGVIVLVLTATTAWPPGLIKTVPVTVHAVLDAGLAVLLIAAPFLFAFSDDDTALVVFLVAGVLLLLETIATRWLPPEAPRARGTRSV